ncbi:hypothetical protein [Nonlabens sp. Asnod3-A02]|uniref:hypothetical protein n=1 Tax=Nonlabens sp. Asnod3-A02 TaxID=3160579 RepID=UPI00386E2283
MIPLKSKYLKKYSGMTLWPFLLVSNKSKLTDALFMNHENIHAVQQKELLVLFFYLCYGLDYLFNLMRYMNHHKAYRNIVFEREAYLNESNLDYLKERKLFSFFKFYGKKYAHE